MNIKFSFFFLFLSLVFTCEGQQKLPKDIDLEQLKGSPKQIIEISEIRPSNQRFKEVFNFNKEGYITKVENYNVLHENDSLSIGDITFYEKVLGRKKRSITLKYRNRDTLRINKYELMNDRTIKIEGESYNNSYRTSVTQELDENNTIIKTTTEITDTSNSVFNINSETQFVYDGDKLSELIITNKSIEEEHKSVRIQNEQNDKFGNFTYRELIDEDNKIVYIVRREYLYY